MNEQPKALSSSASEAVPAAGSGRNILLWALGALSLLLALYAAAGYLWAPRLIKDEAQAWTRKNLGLELAMGEVKADPFRLRVELNDLAIPAQSPPASRPGRKPPPRKPAQPSPRRWSNRISPSP